MLSRLVRLQLLLTAAAILSDELCGCPMWLAAAFYINCGFIVASCGRRQGGK